MGGASGCGQRVWSLGVVTGCGHWVWSVGDGYMYYLPHNEVSLLLLCLCFLAASSYFLFNFVNCFSFIVQGLSSILRTMG